jgi:hypothetical protein
MKIKTKILLGVLTGVAVLMATLPAGVAAKGPPGVIMGYHNLSASGKDNTGADSSYRTNTDDVCVFCHTPHGGTLSAPLWNRNNPTSTWNHYSSSSLSNFMKNLASSRSLNDESLICMSCHDGSISVNHVINSPNDLGGSPIETFNGDPDTTIGLGFIIGSRIGASEANTMGTGDLTDDHPISFSYDDVYNSTDYQIGAKMGQLRASNLASVLYSGAGPRFETRTVAGTGTNRVECTTCHDPHVDYYNNPEYSPFLIIPNAGSNLCLACHIK